MRFTSAFAALLVLSFFVSPAAAATTPGTTADDSRPSGCTEPLTDSVVLCEKSFQDGTAEIVVFVEKETAVSVTDALGWSSGDRDEIPRKQGIILDADQKNTIRLTATEWQNKVVLTLDDGESLVPIRVLDGSPGDLGIMPGSPQTTDPWIAGGTIFVMFAAGFPLAVLYVRRHMGGIFDEW